MLTPPRSDKMPLMHKSAATYWLGSADATTIVTFLADAQDRAIGILARNANGADRRLRKVA